MIEAGTLFLVIKVIKKREWFRFVISKRASSVLLVV
jgi:hypothetical protein